MALKMNPDKQIAAIIHGKTGIQVTWLNPKKSITLTKGEAKIFAQSLLKP
jgi:hypothetical protein